MERGGLHLRFKNKTKKSKGHLSESWTKQTSRVRNKPKRYSDFIELSPSKRRKSEREISDSDLDNTCDSQRSTELLSDDDIKQQDNVQLKRRNVKRNIEHNKVTKAIPSCSKFDKIPAVIIEPVDLEKFSQSLTITSPNQYNQHTPRRIRKAIKKRNIQELQDSTEDSDFSKDSSSDFVPDDDSDEESEKSSSVAEEEEEMFSPKTEDGKYGTKTPEKFKMAIRDKPSMSKDSEYFLASDNYFMMNSSKKTSTSNHRLALLKDFNIADNYSDIAMSDKHRVRIKKLNTSYHEMFNYWLFALSADFNIILYGLGSKRHILQDFENNKLKNAPCVVVNGYFPSLTIKSILETIVIDLLDNTHLPSNLSDVVQLVNDQLEEYGEDLFLIVNNIDGPMLRDAKSQDALASLAQLKKVHLIASIDHINAPLLWDHAKKSKFNFVWCDVTNFMPYTEELSYENTLMNQNSDALQMSSLRSVYQSLTANAKGIFNIIVQNQLDNNKRKNFQGLLFKDLYAMSREQFLVSSDVALRLQLTEFLDHKLVKTKKSCDGNEYLVIPIENALLQAFLDKKTT